MCQQTAERMIRQGLRAYFGRGQVDSLEPVEPDLFRARLVNGGIAYVTVEEDGAVTIQELEGGC